MAEEDRNCVPNEIRKNSPEEGREEKRRFLRRHHAERNLSMSMNNEAINSPIRNGRVALSDLSPPMQ